MFIKICCIGSKQEAALAASLGASAVGLVSKMPSGPGVIPEELISEIASSVPGTMKTFLLTSLRNVEDIIKQQQRCNTNTIQLVDTLQNGTYEELKRELPEVTIVQVLHVIDETSLNEAGKLENNVDAILLDSGRPDLLTKELGGTGRTHNWEISREIVKAVNIPVYLAGGLNPENVKSAIKFVKPSGVDVCSGVRSNGKLDKSKLFNFISAVRSV